MNIQSAIAASRSELVFLVKSIVQLLLWGGLIAIGVLTVFVLFPPAGVMPGHTPQTPAVQAWMLMAMMFISLLSISLLAKKSRNPERKAWIGIHTGIIAVGAATFPWLPQWSGFIMAAVLVLPLSMSIAAGVSARTSEMRPPLHPSIRQNRHVSGSARSAQAHRRSACLRSPVQTAIGHW
jgi:hypothetical protein